MNLIDSAIIKQNITSVIKNWAEETPVPVAIDSVTYDLYESNNPFRKKFDENEIVDNRMRALANTGSRVSAELFSVFANPYYLTHKITQVPTYYQSAVNLYKRNYASKD